MNLRHLRTAALTAAALTALAACSSESPTDADKPAGPSPAEQVSKQAHAYMSAWMAIEPADGKTMCALQTKAARPNFKKDGGTLDGCIKQRAKNSAGETADPGKPKLTIAISKIQDVPASDTHPAGKGALATMNRPGRDQFRYVLRLVKEGDQWLVEQTNDVGDRFKHTEDPVAPVLAQYS